MKCKKCGYDNPIVKKTCQQCSSILEGEIPTLKQQIDRITQEAEDKIQQIVLDHYQQTGVMMSIRLDYAEMTDKLSGERGTLVPIVKIYPTL